MPSAKVVAISSLPARMVEAVRAIECPLGGLSCVEGCARDLRRSGASLARRTTRGRFRDFFVARGNVFRREGDLFRRRVRSAAWLLKYYPRFALFFSALPMRLAMSRQRDRL